MLHGQYINRLTKDMGHAKVPYDWAIIQAGGNDLAWNNPPEVIYEKMQAVWDIPLKAGVKVLALTITEHSHFSPKMKAKWEKLNDLVSSHQQEGFYVAHVAKAIPWTGMDEKERTKIWDDGVHLTKEGYELMGDTIADRLIDIVKEQQPLGTSHNSDTHGLRI
ncbi:hypothetical protein ACLMJK_005456 [Lecanora helva]